MRILSVPHTSSIVPVLYFAVSIIAGCSAHAGTMGKAEYVAAAALKDAVARTTGGLATYRIKGPVPPVLIVRRDGPGDVEVHTKMNDVIVVQEGRATLLISDRVEGNRETAPNEWRGGKILDGHTYELAPGDVLWIPAGLGHQMTLPPGGSFSYLVVKTDAEAPAKTGR